MVFLVPDDPDDLENEEGEESASGKEKATLDESDIEQQDEVPRALQKVELDLDDAPFLEEEEEEDEEEVEEEGAEEGPAIEEKKRRELPPWLTSKKFVLALVAILVLAVAITLAIVFWPEAQEEPAAEPEVTEEEVALPTEEEEEPEQEEITIGFEPFWVEKQDGEGDIHFLHCRFSVVVTSKAAKREIDIKRLTLRDAIYYYLRNKDFAFLADTENMEDLKRDVLSVINKYLGSEQIQTLLVEKFLVQ